VDTSPKMKTQAALSKTDCLSSCQKLESHWGYPSLCDVDVKKRMDAIISSQEAPAPVPTPIDSDRIQNILSQIRAEAACMRHRSFLAQGTVQSNIPSPVPPSTVIPKEILPEEPKDCFDWEEEKRLLQETRARTKELTHEVKTPARDRSRSQSRPPTRTFQGGGTSSNSAFVPPSSWRQVPPTPRTLQSMLDRSNVTVGNSPATSSTAPTPETQQTNPNTVLVSEGCFDGIDADAVPVQPESWSSRVNADGPFNPWSMRSRSSGGLSAHLIPNTGNSTQDNSPSVLAHSSTPRQVGQGAPACVRRGQTVGFDPRRFPASDDDADATPLPEPISARIPFVSTNVGHGPSGPCELGTQVGRGRPDDSSTPRRSPLIPTTVGLGPPDASTTSAQVGRGAQRDDGSESADEQAEEVQPSAIASHMVSTGLDYAPALRQVANRTRTPERSGSVPPNMGSRQRSQRSGLFRWTGRIAPSPHDEALARIERDQQLVRQQRAVDTHHLRVNRQPRDLLSLVARPEAVSLDPPLSRKISVLRCALNTLKVNIHKGRDDCAICLESMHHTRTSELPCQHIFHMECISKWVVKSKTEEALCPLCKSVILT